MRFPAPAEASQPLILIINDDAGDQLRMRVTLEREGYCVLVATARDAFSVLRILSPTVILFDVRADGEDALALTRWLKQTLHGESIQVVALTSDPKVGGRMVAAKSGCAGYIAKPVDLRRLGDQVAGFIE